MATFSFLSTGPEDTLALGEALASWSAPGEVITLEGDLGMGKTVLVKGLARGLDVPGWSRVPSPTFVVLLVHEGILPLHHLDLYRISGDRDAAGLDPDTLLTSEGLTAIEWPGHWRELWRHLPGWGVTIRQPDPARDDRTITLVRRGPLPAETEADIRADMDAHPLRTTEAETP